MKKQTQILVIISSIVQMANLPIQHNVYCVQLII